MKKKAFLFVLSGLSFVFSSMQGIIVTYETGTIPFVGLMLLGDMKNASKMKGHIENNLGLHKDSDIAAGILGATAGVVTIVSDTVGDVAGSGAVPLGAAVGTGTGYGVKYGLEGLADITLDQIKKGYGADFIMLYLTKTGCLDANRLRKFKTYSINTNGNPTPVYAQFYTYSTHKKKLTPFGQSQIVNPFGKYTLNITKDNEIVLQEVSKDGGISCK